jgi:transposase-like protein
MSEGKSSNNRVEGSHAPIRLREREMRGFRGRASIQRFLAVHAAIADAFSTYRHLMPASSHRALRGEAFTAWRQAARAAA